MELDRRREERFDALFRRHVSGVASYCRWRGASHSDVDDAVAEVFLVVWRRLEVVPNEPATRAWLYATARKVLANKSRGDHRRAKLTDALSGQPVLPDSENPAVGQVREALAELAPRDVEILLLAEWEGLTPAEIATVMGAPAVTVRVRLHRARSRFRAVFEAQAPAARAGEAKRAPRRSEALPVSPLRPTCVNPEGADS